MPSGGFAFYPTSTRWQVAIAKKACGYGLNFDFEAMKFFLKNLLR